MYLPSNLSTCEQGPLPASYNPFAGRDYDLLTGAAQRAQGAFDALVNRFDLGPNGMPWGSGRLGHINFGLARTAPLDITWPGVSGPGAGWNPNPPADLGPASNPRVVDFPFCSPIAYAQEFVPPAPVEECVTGNVGGVVYGPAAGTTPQTTPPPLHILPPAIYTTPNPRNVVQPTGNLCADLQSGAVLQSDADPMAVYECSKAGWVGVGPSSLDVINAAQAQAQTGVQNGESADTDGTAVGVSGLGGGLGLGCCGSCSSGGAGKGAAGGKSPGPCAGNARVNATRSPADIARNGNGGAGWVWFAALTAAAVYVVTQQQD
jgi:hypothetical protein